MFNDPNGQKTPLKTILSAESPSIPADWGQGRTAFGGLSTFLVVRAIQAAAHTPPARPLQSVSVHFVGPVPIGPVHVASQVLRTGRYMTQTAGTLRVGDQIALTVQGAHGQPRASKLELEPPSAPELPPPDRLPEMPFIPGMMPSFTQHVDYRWATEHFPFTGGPSPLIRGWCRLDEDVVVDPATVLLLIDAWPAGILTMAPGFVAASSVLWMVTFFNSTALPPRSWLKTEQRTTVSHSGHAENIADIWTADGQLVARSRQLVTIYG